MRICFNFLIELCKIEPGGFMTIWQIILLIAGCGAVGGIVNCAISGEFNYPRFDAAAKVWRAGWIGNVLFGAVAAAFLLGIFWSPAGGDLLNGGMVGGGFAPAPRLHPLFVRF